MQDCYKTAEQSDPWYGSTFMEKFMEIHGKFMENSWSIFTLAWTNSLMLDGWMYLQENCRGGIQVQIQTLMATIFLVFHFITMPSDHFGFLPVSFALLAWAYPGDNKPLVDFQTSPGS
ncbi:uncharacterized protein SPSK_10329 [Sporothrix schenckii 1099-18]|uniref:Uncharacterized protein n=1 Tax=Sporothrix schenckii 1099-18 TaxID=1397361 RepID=A0A0F2LUB1_SPOSC|nr:uncharacterized protein SPSK_10329 [Sporothrix schenckii 1099-18]KJR80105.1 hypothetical protein SPSK_10329 [Sporothrix schenckii 1099-18]